MSHLLAASIGSYPRTGETKDEQRYPRALGHFERKEISAHALRDVEQSVSQEIIREQLDTGIDEVTDGLIAWPDPITRFTRHLSQVKTGGLARYFDNNFYYRVPTISGKPRIGPAVSTAEFRFARDTSNKPVRAILTGPLTLALHTAGAVKPFDKLPARLDFFTTVISQEIAALAAENAPIIQIDEPALVVYPAHLALFQKAAVKLAAAKGKSRLALALYFGDVSPLASALKNLPFDIWQLEIGKDADTLLETLASAPRTVTLGLGIVNGRSTWLESADTIVQRLKPWLARRPDADHHLTPSCGLEYLPRASAAAKLRRLAEIRRLLSGTLPGETRA